MGPAAHLWRTVLDEHEQHVRATFEADGAGYTIKMDPSGETPSYLVTYGWSISYELPEIIIFGDHLMIGNLLRLHNEMIDALEGMATIIDDQRWPMQWGGQQVAGRFVNPAHVTPRFFGDALLCRELAGASSPMPAYQLFWPDENGRFPWERGCAQISRALQPLLFKRLFWASGVKPSLWSRAQAIINNMGATPVVEERTEPPAPVQPVRKVVQESGELSISEMIERVPQGEDWTFERSIHEPGEERYFQVWQSWDYGPGRLTWRNQPSMMDAPSPGSRRNARIPASGMVPPEIDFAGPASQVVDFYSTGTHAFLISDKLFRLIEAEDAGSLDHLAFDLVAQDGTLPFHAVMPSRLLDAVDPRRTTVQVRDEKLAEFFFRKVDFPEGVVFDNERLTGIASFSDLDVSGWFWSAGLIAAAKAHGIRGLYTRSVASPDGREVDRL